MFARFKQLIKELANINDYIDTVAAEKEIREGIYFKGPNVWILTFAIVLASVGLNINSTAVIIGAMLISPLMGPIIGLGLGIGINDTKVLKESAKNLIVMVVISILASFIYFALSPLRLENPTELLSRTNPTIYDVLIALFGGFAGIFEISRKKKGTVLSGVAIATALMPPLCTAGFGLATLNIKYFAGALLLFTINTVFITLATYMMVKFLKFPEQQYADEKTEKRVKRIITTVVILVIVPSIWSAIVMIRNNAFEQKVAEFIQDNKNLDNGYIYDYKLDYRKGGSLKVYITGGMLTASEKEALLSSAENHGLKESQVEFKEHTIGSDTDNASEKIVKGIYERTDSEIAKREAEIDKLETEIASLKKDEIPYAQVTREAVAQYPEIKDLYLSRGASVTADSLKVTQGIIAIVETTKPLTQASQDKLTAWLKVRLGDTTVTLLSKPYVKD
jgi:uncharacterized hydrophobic protein (TIGR00271 family)